MSIDSTRLLAAALLALPATGCYTTTFQSGLPAAPPALEYQDKWHSGVVLGIAELSGPYDLKKVCPNGWAEIRTETSLANGFVELVTSGVYNPQSVTVRCAAPAPAAAPPPPTAPVSQRNDH